MAPSSKRQRTDSSNTRSGGGESGRAGKEADKATNDELDKLRAAASAAANSIFASMFGEGGVASVGGVGGAGEVAAPVPPSPELWPEVAGVKAEASAPAPVKEAPASSATTAAAAAAPAQQPQRAASWSDPAVQALAQLQEAMAVQQALLAGSQVAGGAVVPEKSGEESNPEKPKDKPKAKAATELPAKMGQREFDSANEAAKALVKSPTDVPLGNLIKQRVIQDKLRILLPKPELLSTALRAAVEVSNELRRNPRCQRRAPRIASGAVPAAHSNTFAPVPEVIEPPPAEEKKDEAQTEQEAADAVQLALTQQLLSVQEAQNQALAAAAAAAAEPSNPKDQACGQMYLLAQLAEESSRMAAAAAACCANPELDPMQATALAQAGQEAAQRGSWASTTMDSCFPNNDCAGTDKEEWASNLRQIVKAAAEAAENSASNCRVQQAEIAHKLPPSAYSAFSQRSKVPCKWFMTGVCRKGAACEFSHDPLDMQPRPLQKKIRELCVYFQRGNCTRGTACPFAHGDDELAEVSRLVTEVKTERRFFPRGGGLYGRGGVGVRE